MGLRAPPELGDERPLPVSKQRTANLLGTLAGAVAGRLDRQLKQHPNQTDSSASALNLVAGYEGCSNVELSRALQLSHTATVRLLDKLQEAGFVERRDGADRRSVALFLTAAGRAHARQIVQARQAVLLGLIDALSPAQRSQLDGLADTLLSVMTVDAAEADHLCRLCDEGVCAPARCPVHRAALQRP